MTCSCRQAVRYPGSATHAPGGQAVVTGGTISDYVAGRIFRETLLVLALTSPAWLVMLLTSKTK